MGVEVDLSSILDGAPLSILRIAIDGEAIIPQQHDGRPIVLPSSWSAEQAHVHTNWVAQGLQIQVRPPICPAGGQASSTSNAASSPLRGTVGLLVIRPGVYAFGVRSTLVAFQIQVRDRARLEWPGPYRQGENDHFTHDENPPWVFAQAYGSNVVAAIDYDGSHYYVRIVGSTFDLSHDVDIVAWSHDPEDIFPLSSGSVDVHETDPRMLLSLDGTVTRFKTSALCGDPLLWPTLVNQGDCLAWHEGVVNEDWEDGRLARVWSFAPLGCRETAVPSSEAGEPRFYVAAYSPTQCGFAHVSELERQDELEEIDYDPWNVAAVLPVVIALTVGGVLIAVCWMLWRAYGTRLKGFVYGRESSESNPQVPARERALNDPTRLANVRLQPRGSMRPPGL